ncbi:MAG: hypothetical protein SPF98_05380 [Campylobacter sp.]|nr:hypothetical protein [Campylobacter sp.]
MAREPKNYLTDKDIRDLEIKNIKYRKTIGAPKELYIIVNPSGIKKFVIKKENRAFDSFGILKEFRPGIYSVSEARRDANKILKDLSENKDTEIIKGKNDKFNYDTYFERFIDYKKKFDRCTDDYLKKMRRAHELYILPSLAKRDIKTIKYSDIIDILNPVTERYKEVENQKNRKYSYL